ncbi:hypothetical protein Zmor_014266 [Zophobas morio]|uniref:Uncharacterized protein n=1 Tax=Zophobas morio TaxID=2755281 RepID=A0AA38IEH3_9CUCU|nr:hypothetical protein Zmor_014266 [Zophobas morio]
MFRRTSTMPQRIKFCLTTEQIISDIEAVYRNEEQRNTLYFCLDQVPPKEHNFERIEEFLKGTQDLERSSNILDGLKCELDNLQQDIMNRISTLKQRSGNP